MEIFEKYWLILPESFSMFLVSVTFYLLLSGHTQSTETQAHEHG